MERHARYKKSQIEFLEMKTIMSEMKNSGNGFRVKLHIAEERTSEHEDIKLETL